jgi:tRNA (cytidine/uridine-2'-O-)-methyltransferase
MIRIVLFQPDIPQNVGTILRLSACLECTVDIIEPCGFIWHDQKLKRAGMDYLDHASIIRHPSWEHFDAFRATQLPNARLLLLSTKANTPYHHYSFNNEDILIFGSESSGVPDYLDSYIHQKLRIPMGNNMRSLNVAMSVAMVVGEAIRQTTGFQHLT